MSPTALRRAVGLSALSIALSLILGYVHFGGTFAIWDGSTSNASSAFAAGWVGPPTGLGTPTVRGYGASLAWTPGTAGPVTGQQLWGADGGTGGSASCGSYGSLVTMASATTASYNYAGSSTYNGHWYCYRMVSTSATAWTASASFTPLRVGLFPTGTAALSNTGTAGTLTNGDKVTVTFNQNINAPTGTRVCAFSGASGSGVLLLGDSTCSTTSDSYTLGKITGLTIGGSGHTLLTATSSRTSATLTVTITQTGPTVSGTGTFTASTSITSSTGSAAACQSSNCQVSTSGGF